MADLASTIIDAYRQRENDVRSQPMQQLQQVGALQGILASAQKQQNEQAGILAQQQFRAGIRPDMSHEQLLQHAIGSGLVGPKDLATILQGEQNKKITAAATAEQARLRLSQQADQFSQTQALKYSQLDLAEKSGADKTAIAQARLALDTQDKAFKQQISQESLRLTGEAGNYNFGSARPNIPGVTIGAPSAGAAPAGGVLQTQRVGAVPPADEMLVRQLEAQQRAGQPVRAEGALQGALSGAGGGAGAPSNLTGILAAAGAQAEPEASAGPVSTAAPNNLDTRDIRFGSQAPQAAPIAAPAAAPSAPLSGLAAAPTIPKKPGEFTAADAPAGMLVPKERAKWAEQQNRGSIAGNAPISPETATRIAQQALSGDFSGAAGWSRNQTAKAQIENEITRLSTELGKSGGDLTGAKAMSVANRTALTAVTKDLAAITPFKEMLDQNASVAIDLGRQIASDKTNSAFVNKPLIWVKNNLSNRPDIAEYLAQIHFVEVEAARVLTQPRLVGQLTDQAIKDMKSILDGSMTIESTERVLKRIQMDGNNRIGAMKSQQQRTLADIRGTAPRTRASDAATGVDTSNPLLR